MNISKQIQILVLVLFPACLLGANFLLNHIGQINLEKSNSKYFEFPKPTGEYAVGTKLIELVDESRLDSVKGEPEKSRRLIVQAWYPAYTPEGLRRAGPSSLLTELRRASPTESKLDKPTSPYTYEMLKMLKNMLAEGEDSTDLSNQLDLIRTYAIFDAQVLTDKSKFPIVIFAHGYATARGEYSSLCEDIASHGYIVFMVMHTYATWITRFADGSETKFVRERSVEAITDCSTDIRFMLDNIQQGKAFKELTSSCDFNAIGIVGHSLGGMMANHVCRMDSRVKAGISLDGPLYGSGAKEPSHKPFMFMLASTFNEMFGDDEGLEFAGMTKEEFATCIDDFCQKNGSNSYKIILKNSEHCTFSDCPILVKILKEIYKTDDIHMDTGTIDALKAIEIIRLYIINFFDKYLKGQSSQLLDGQAKRYSEYVDFKSWAK